jgi:hypothetical protein
LKMCQKIGLNLKKSCQVKTGKFCLRRKLKACHYQEFQQKSESWRHKQNWAKLTK